MFGVDVMVGRAKQGDGEIESVVPERDPVWDWSGERSFICDHVRQRMTGVGGGTHCDWKKPGVDRVLLFLVVVKSFADFQLWWRHFLILVVCSEENSKSVSSPKPHQYHQQMSIKKRTHVNQLRPLSNTRTHSIEYEKRGEENWIQTFVIGGEINHIEKEDCLKFLVMLWLISLSQTIFVSVLFFRRTNQEWVEKIDLSLFKKINFFFLIEKSISRVRL